MSGDEYLTDLFRNSLKPLTRLFDAYQVRSLPTVGWTQDLLLSGGQEQGSGLLLLYTGVVANSRALLYTRAQFLNSGNINVNLVDFNKPLEIYLSLVRITSDTEAIARVQLKNVATEGALAAKGIGLEIQDLAVLGEAYGTARNTVALTTLTHFRLARFRIRHIPGSKVEFFVNGVKAGELTGTAVPSGSSGVTSYVNSIINGATGTINAQFYMSNIWITQGL